MSARTLFAAVVAWALFIPVAHAANKTPAAPAADAQTGQNADVIAEAIFKKADKNGDKKMTLSEFRVALTYIEQYAATLPAKPVAKNAKPINPQALALGGPPAGMPDLSNGKHLSLDEFKAAFPGLLSQAQDAVAQLRAQAAAAGTMKKKGY